MVRMTPKALRFADEAAHSYLDREGGQGSDREIWAGWTSTWDRSRADVPLAGPDGYVEVPDDVAQAVLPAIERMISDMRAQSDAEEDPDLGNDLLFLDNARVALVAGLDHGPASRF